MNDRARPFIKALTVPDDGVGYRPGDRVRVFNTGGRPSREFLVYDANGPYEVVRCTPLSGDQAGQLQVELQSIGYR